ncbi:hypothetical protein B9Z55_001288 [Caenorhabditis nigoni]|nr:hypothetical protein B9Z55_001288 [Caenorhabditis nigoni]
MKLQCTSPERDLIVYPRWLCFNSQNGYKTPLFVRFFVENREPYPVTYNVKAREKIFRVDSSSGILKSGERKTIKLFLISSDDWPLSFGEYTQKRIKMAIECLRLPEQIEPSNPKEASMMAKTIWKRSFNEWPLERIYTKVYCSSPYFSRIPFIFQVNIFIVSSAKMEEPMTTVTTKYSL